MRLRDADGVEAGVTRAGAGAGGPDTGETGTSWVDEGNLDARGAGAHGACCDVEGAFTRNVKSVYRLCYSYMGSPHDAEDATQATFMKLVSEPRAFDGAEHERAWLLVVAANHCKDVLKSAARMRSSPSSPDLPDLPDPAADVQLSEVLEAVYALPPNLKDCVYLHYYEGYKTDEIAQMTGTPASTVRNRLRDARALLKKALA